MRSGQYRELHAWRAARCSARGQSTLHRLFIVRTCQKGLLCPIERAPVPHTAYGGEAQLGEKALMVW